VLFLSLRFVMFSASTTSPKVTPTIPRMPSAGAFNRGLKDARKKGTLGEGQWNDTDWIWQPQ
jgi:hypothetical protein